MPVPQSTLFILPISISGKHIITDSSIPIPIAAISAVHWLHCRSQQVSLEKPTTIPGNPTVTAGSPESVVINDHRRHVESTHNGTLIVIGW